MVPDIPVGDLPLVDPPADVLKNAGVPGQQVLVRRDGGQEHEQDEEDGKPQEQELAQLPVHDFCLRCLAQSTSSTITAVANPRPRVANRFLTGQYSGV